MKNWLKYWLVFCLLLCRGGVAMAQQQCTVLVDTAGVQHINCPNGGAIGVASIIQAGYINYSWQNTTNGQLYNGGGGNGGTFRTDLDAGFYVVTGSLPYINSCPQINYSDTFEILEAEPVFQFNPTQACPSLCNVLVTASMQVAIPSVSYTYQFDANPIVSLPNSLANQCGGLHTYEIFANNISCGIENIGISQFAQMNLATSVINPTCVQQGSATVNITGVGASGITTYCTSTPQYNSFTTIDNIVLVGDNTTISNNTSSICDTYQDYTAQSADVTPGNSYNLILDLGTCNFNGPNGSAQYLIDIANVYVDWNIDGDFNDLNELVGQVSPIQSPSTHTLAITVPIGAIPGQSRMRIVAQNSQYQPTNQALPCDVNTAWFGSTEDYTLVVSGSVATPVTYLWDDPNFQSTATATNLGAGTYTVTITDANGCTASDTAIVSLNGISASVIITDSILCYGDFATIDVAVQGGSGWYLYQLKYLVLGNWYTFSQQTTYDTATFIMLPANTYQIIVSDTNQACSSQISIVITQPNPLSVSLTPSGAQMYCQNTLISNLTVIANGGIVPYQYQWYEYSPPNQVAGGVIIPNATDSFLVPPTNTVGITYYFCTVTGGQSCEDTTGIIAVEIVSAPIFTLQPQDSTVCTGSNLTINVEDSLSATVGQTTHIYQWYENSICDTSTSGGAVPATGPGNNTNTYTPQTTTPGTTYYYCTVVIPQIVGCNTIISECAKIIVNPIPTVTLSAVPTPACLGDDIVLTASTSIPVNRYRFRYDNGGGWTNLTNPGYGLLNPVTFSNISTTTQFQVKVREDNGCINSSWSSIITVPVNITPITGSIWHN